jgi:tetratricopeptide (TPR) repeat protein
MKASDSGVNSWAAPRVLLVAVLAVFAIYASSLHVPFLLDDEVTILANPSIREWWNFRAVFNPPAEVFSAGRPLVNLSFALNYALGGTSVVGYHVFNLLIHALACLVLYALVRRTLELELSRGESRRVPRTVAVVAAVLWGLHPLQTAAVTYISQRAEELMALFYLLTLYAFVRAASDGPSRRWEVISVTCCLLGALAKEPIVTAPFVVLLFDRAFFSESFAHALRARTALYAGYALSWCVLAWLMIAQSLALRGVGFATGVSPLDYGLAASRAFTRYVALAVWPQPLVFDYGEEFLSAPALETSVAVVFVAFAAGLTLYAWRRSAAVGFCATAFFVILAPTTSLVPIALQPMAENRMYLPLALFLVLLTVGVVAAVGLRRAGALGMLAALAFALLTLARNHDFRSAESIWTDTVAKRGNSSRAQNNLGLALLKRSDRQADAVAHLQAALRLKPDFPEAHNNLGLAYAEMPARQADAIEEFSAAIHLKPTFAQAHANLANSLSRTPGREAEALDHYRTALGLQPANAQLHANFATLLAAAPARRVEATAHFETALRLDSRSAAAHAGLARLLAPIVERRADAISHYEAALRIDATDAETFFNFANLLAKEPATLSRAIDHYEQALRLSPTLAPAYNNLAIALYQADRLDDAIARLELAQSRGVSDANTVKNLAQLRAFRAR